ncbi:hypothetical protein ACFY2H_40115 [Streptomyces griseofuscus]|uniref:hypothetical protein n=1 Tax=Streptomyces griseofuscus TaxID=146922 RepID=UPI0036BF79EC
MFHEVEGVPTRTVGEFQPGQFTVRVAAVRFVGGGFHGIGVESAERGTVITEITHRDNHSGQMRAATALNTIIEDALRVGLPPLHWTVLAGDPRLVGEPSTTGEEMNDASKRAAFEAWAAHLGAERTVEDASGSAFLHAAATKLVGDKPVSVTVMTTLHHDGSDTA